MFHFLLCLLTNVERRKRSTFSFKFYCVSLLKNKIVLVNALRAGLWLKWRECKTLRERWGKMYLTTNHRHDSLSSNTLPHTQRTFSLPRSHVPIAQAKTGDGIIDCNVSGKVLLDSKKECINSVLNSYTYILCFKCETKNIYKHLTTS